MSDSFVREPARLDKRWLMAVLVALVAAVAVAITPAASHGGIAVSNTAPTTNEPAKPELTKTAHAKWVKTIEWDIVKKLRIKKNGYADRQNWQIFWGDSVWANYVINLAKKVEHKYVVYGTIRIPLDRPQTEATSGPITIEDVITFTGGKQIDVPAKNLRCVDFAQVPETVIYGGELVCHYTVYLERPDDGVNTVSVSLGPDKLITASAEFKFGTTPDYVRGHERVWVRDSNFVGETVRGPFYGSKRLPYKKHFECDSKQNPMSHTNIAKLLAPATLDSNDKTYTDATGKYDVVAKDTATLKLECFGLRVKTGATGEFKRLIRWKIAKSARLERIELVNVKGDSKKKAAEAVVKYRVKVDSYPDDLGFEASGKIAITNKHPRRSAEVVDISDVIVSKGGDPIRARVWCNGDKKDSGLRLPVTIAPDETRICYWHTRLPDGSKRVNVASVELQNFHREIGAKTERTGTTWFKAYAPVTFGKPWKLIDETVGVHDTLAPKGFLGRVHFKQTPKVFRYDVAVRAGGLAPECGKGALRNVASLEPADTKIEYRASVTIPIHVRCVDPKKVPPIKVEPPKKDPREDDKKVDPDAKDGGIVCVPGKGKPWHLIGSKGEKSEFFESGKSYKQIMRMGFRGRNHPVVPSLPWKAQKDYDLRG